MAVAKQRPQPKESLEVIHKDETGAKLRIGKTRIIVHAPRITPEEREKRLLQIHRQMWIVWQSINSQH